MNKKLPIQEQDILELLQFRRDALEDKLSKNPNTRNIQIKDIDYLGDFFVPFSEHFDTRSLFLVKELDPNTQIVQEKYYADEDLIAISYNNTLIPCGLGKKDPICFLFLQKTLPSHDKQYSLQRLETEHIEKILKTLDLKKEEFDYIQELPLNQSVPSQLSKKQSMSFTPKETVSLTQNIQGETLGHKLGLESQFVTLALVSSSQIHNKTSSKRPNTSLSFVALKPNGESIVLDESILSLDPISGTSPNNNSLKIPQSGVVTREPNLLRFNIKTGSSNDYLTISQNHPFENEISYSQRSPGKGEYVDFNLESNYTYYRDHEVARLNKERNGSNSATEILEKTALKENDTKNVENVQNIDFNKNNDEPQKASTVFDSEIKKLMDNDVISGSYSEKEVREYFFSLHKKHPRLSIKEISKYIEEDLERTSHTRSPRI